MRHCLMGLVALSALTGCGADHPERQAPKSKRQRDSTIGASRLPGAQGVGGALKASDSAASRRAQEEAAAREP
jgi:hypothetical protein